MSAMRRVIAGLAVLGAVSLSGCGFSPMYGSNGTSAQMSDMRIATGQERIDYLLQEALHDRMGSRNADGPYVLRTETEVRDFGLGVGADAIARRYAVRVTVVYRVFRDGDIDPILTGTAQGEASYDVSTSTYDALSSERDAEERAVGIVADRMTIQLARSLRELDAQ